MPEWTAELKNLYWQLRYTRNRNRKRKWWRRIAAEKKRLLATGVSYIELHLITRVLANPNNQKALERLQYFQEYGSPLE